MSGPVSQGRQRKPVGGTGLAPEELVSGGIQTSLPGFLKPDQQSYELFG